MISRRAPSSKVMTGTVIEGDEPAGELFCRVAVNRVDYPAEVLPVELTNLIDISDPNGNMFNLHKTSMNNIPNSDKKDPKTENVWTLRVLHAHARSCQYASVLSRHSLLHVCSFGAYLLHLGNVGKRVSRRFLGLQLFHVKHNQGYQAKTY